MSVGNYPSKYLLFNQKLSKHLAIVLKIEGVPDLYGIADTYTAIRYGDAGIVYGLPGLVYGGLRRLGQVKPYMMLDSGLTIQQKVEPEQGKGNIGTMNISLIDFNGEISKLISPGQVVDEILSGKLCTLYLGYTETSFPEDYAIVYRGFITKTTCPPGKVTLQISDCTMKTRNPLFDVPSTTLTNPIAATGGSPITITVGNTAKLHQQILGPNGQYDPTVQTYVVVDSEIMQYAATGILSATQILVTRPLLGSQLADHDVGAGVAGSVGFGFNVGGINAIDFALKLMLSGWNGPAVTGSQIQSFVYDYNGNFVSNQFLLATDDATLDLGITPGDYFTVSGSTGGNNLSGLVTGVAVAVNGSTRLVQTNQTFNLENPTTAKVAFRSQYDTFPITCGMQCAPAAVDVSTFQAMKNTYFSSGIFYLRSYYDSAAVGKDVVDGDIMLPIGAYGISRYGRISMAITKPPLPGSGTKLVQIDYTSVIDPDKIVVERAINMRSFYNEVSYEYDFDFANGAFSAVQYFLDTTSISQFKQTNILPIQAKSVSSALGGASLAQQRGSALLGRFKKCLITIELTVNWGVGSLLEVSDIVLLKDNGTLKIMNFNTGVRDIGEELYEVIDRNYQILNGTVKLKLIGGLGFALTDRFGLISPSSILGTGNTTTKVRVTPSFGQTLVANEIAKWSPLVGCPVLVHNASWSVTGSSTITQVDPTDIAALILSPPLPFAPSAGNILEIAPYNMANSLLKKLYAFITPTVPVSGGISQTQFLVTTPFLSRIFAGNQAILRNPSYSLISNPATVVSVSGNTVTLGASAGFVPNNTFKMEGIGFADGLSYYKYD